MAFKFSKIFRNPFETPDPQPTSASLSFKRPMSIEETVRRALRAELTARAQRPPQLDEDDSFDEPDEFQSEHEMVFEPSLGKEITKHEKRYIDEQRKAFDGYVTEAKRRKKARPVKEEVPPKDEVEG